MPLPPSVSTVLANPRLATGAGYGWTPSSKSPAAPRSTSAPTPTSPRYGPSSPVGAAYVPSVSYPWQSPKKPAQMSLGIQQATAESRERLGRQTVSALTPPPPVEEEPVEASRFTTLSIGSAVGGAAVAYYAAGHSPLPVILGAVAGFFVGEYVADRARAMT